MTARARLTDALVLSARPRAREYAIHATALQVFMLRVQPNGARSWVFPRDGGDGPLNRNSLWNFWKKTRETAGIVADARLHDLRHSHASHAVMNGESLHVAGRLLGHRRASTTNRYVHLDDATLSHAAERVALAIRRKLCDTDCSEILGSEELKRCPASGDM